MNEKETYLRQQMKNMDRLLGIIMYVPDKCSKFMSKLYYAILYRVHPKHKYQVLDTGLPPGYYDLDTRILYAVMNNFIDLYKTCPHSYFTRDCDWNTHPEIITADEFHKQWFDVNRAAKEELDIIYDWWLDRYLKITKDHEDYWKNYKENELSIKNRKILHQEMHKLEDDLEKEADEMLQRLMKHRRCLWD